MEFSQEAKFALQIIQSTNQNLFITGKAGTGKSTLLEHIRNLPDQNMIVLAPTGIAAINVKGETIHSFFKLKPGYELDEAYNARLNKKKTSKYRAIKTILIDEISMVRADILDAIDVFLKRTRDVNQAFGGVRMIFFGDLYQLPPVVNKQNEIYFYQNYKTPYFFSAHVFKQTDLFSEAFSLTKIELKTIYRQTDKKFVDILNGIRENTISYDQLSELNKRVIANYSGNNSDEFFIHLMSTNAGAQNINNSKLFQLEGDITEFKASKQGKIGNLQPNEEHICVKKGAQVMFINNDYKRRWVNGTLGVISKISKEFDESGAELEILYVKLENGKEVKVSKHTWDISKYSFKDGVFTREEIGTFTQIPLKLAWAITIHKSQGKTFEHVVIDLEKGSFAHGQTYVALSRCTSLEGIILKRAIKHSDIITDKLVMSY
ncbi:MAG: AAA family ATPase [Bacteroidales bacterium]|nr:AAA family ATPase [Bacteroidales bacterium]